jgi:hypothetical protein
MRRAQGQSERQIVRRVQLELAGLVVLLLSLFGAAAAASARPDLG